MEVGVRELKKHLSEYLERASRGERIQVTDRGRPKALLGPLPGTAREQAIAEGWLRPGQGRAPADAVVRQTASRQIGETLGEDRGT